MAGGPMTKDPAEIEMAKATDFKQRRIAVITEHHDRVGRLAGEVAYEHGIPPEDVASFVVIGDIDPKFFDDALGIEHHNGIRFVAMTREHAIASRARIGLPAGRFARPARAGKHLCQVIIDGDVGQMEVS